MIQCPAEIEARLAAAGRATDDGIDLVGTALGLAALDRPGVELGWYERHLADLERETRATVAPLGSTSLALGLEAAAASLATVIAGRYGYCGDRETFDDLQNANLVRVIDRRRGLPVALGIIYMTVARGLGWGAVGLAFPAHFVIRLELGGRRAVLDPFNGGRVLDPVALRQLLKQVAGGEAELSPAHHAPVSDRDVLLRLHGNVKQRLLQAERIAEAAQALDAMLQIAPGRAALWREHGLLQARAGNLGAAIRSIERFMGFDLGAEVRHQTAALLQRLKAQLN